MRLILASASPRRADLLRAAGYAFDTMSVDVDEQVRPGEPAAEYVRRLAAEKSAAGMSAVSGVGRHDGPRELDGPPEPDGPPEGGPYVRGPYVLGADTAVVVDGRILGKPRDDEDAARMLRVLSGRGHDVMTGVSLRGDGCEVGRVITTVVYFCALTDAEIRWYVGTGEGRDKAGGYAIQGLASRFIPGIEGSYSNVVGLPVAAVSELIQQLHLAGSRDILTGSQSQKSL